MNRGQFMTILTGLIGLYEIIVASRILQYLGIYLPRVQHRAISLVLILVVIYLTYSFRGEKRKNARLAWYDAPLLIAGSLGAGFVALFYDIILNYTSFGYLDTLGLVLAGLLGLVLLDAVRRTSGWPLVILICLMMGITLFQNYLPGLLNGRGFAFDRLAYGLYVGAGGIFGLPLGVATSIIIVFLVYARLLQESGVGEWFTNLALAATGRSRGGPAKAAVLSSGMFGMISGSVTGNVATTGAFTIPLMIQTGYRPKVAGAVESVASSGGSIMPPVMGAVAFVMAEWINVPYSDVVKAAFIPAVLYFLVLFASVHFEALSKGIQPMAKFDGPSALTSFKDGWFYLIPLGSLVYLLVGRGLAPDIAGMLSLPLLIGSSFFSRNRQNWLTPKRIFLSLSKAVHTWVTIAIITAAVGMLIGSLELSGLGVRVPGFLLDVSGGNLPLTLLFVGLSSLVLGMGLDPTPAYMTLAALAAPALITLGLPPMAAHLYVVYWGLASFITPPVCLAVFVACGLSGTKVWETGWEAVKLGIAIYLVPVAFAFDQSLLLEGSLDKLAISIVTALIGSVTIAAGLRGYGLRPMNVFQRIIGVAAGIMLIAPNIPLSIAGLVLIALVLAWQHRTIPVTTPIPAADR